MQDLLRENGLRVFVACEAATILFTHGAICNDLEDTACQKAFRDFVINMQLTLEDRLLMLPLIIMQSLCIDTFYSLALSHMS